MKMDISEKAELADFCDEYDMEVESEGIYNGDIEVSMRATVASDTDRPVLPHRGGLRVRMRKPKKSDLMGILVMQMTKKLAAREDARKERVEDRRRERKNMRDAAEAKAEDRR